MSNFWIEYFYNLDTILNGGGKIPSTSIKKVKETNILKQKLYSLGWNKSFISKNLKDLNDEMIDGYNDNHIITGFSSSWIKRYGISDNISLTLINIGINKKIANYLEIVLKPLAGECYTDTQIIDIAIEYIQGKYNPITSINTLFYMNENITLKWFEYNYNKNKYIRVMNIPYKCSIKLENNINTITNSINHIENNSTYYYHVASWKSFDSICKGIYHGAGRQCLDFGLRPGFYLSRKVVDCLDWGEKKSKLFSNEIAIFIFSIPNIIPNTLKFKSLKGKEWVNITSLSRQCNKPDIEINELINYDFIYGDMVSNPSEVKYGEIPRTHNPPKKQLVSKTTNSDNYLQNRIIGCYFFKK